MTFPFERDIEIPILKEIERAGGQVRRNDNSFYQCVASHFPQLTGEDLGVKLSNGQSKWTNKVQWVFRRLVKDKGELEIPTRGILRITGNGKQRLMRKGVAITEKREEIQTKSSRALGEMPVKLAKKTEEEPHRPTHDELVQKIKELGEMLGKKVEGPWGPVYKHDCVWRDNPYANPKLVVEVCDRGNLDKDIASLIWAVKNWNAKGILVLFEETDFHTAQKKLAQESQIYPLRADDVLKLHSSLQAGNIQAVRSIFTV